MKIRFLTILIFLTSWSICSQEVNFDLEECELPKKLEYIKNDEYLNNRGFNKRYYEQFKPAITNFFLERKLQDKFIYF